LQLRLLCGLVDFVVVYLIMLLLLIFICTDVEEITSDVLGMMMIARDPESGQGMSDNELRDQVMTLMLAGHEVGRHIHYM